MEADFYIGGGWGDSVMWQSESDFDGDWGAKEKIRFSVYGYKKDRPKIWDTLLGEFERSFIKFQFVKVVLMNDPPDMFFGVVEPIEQQKKDE